LLFVVPPKVACLLQARLTPQAIKILSAVKGIDLIYLNEQDVVRHRLVREIIEAYNK
jgi:phosphate starvation-inducible protein PhoH